MLLIRLYCFGGSDIACRDVCLLLNIMEQDSTGLVVLKAALFPDILTRLLKIIHRPVVRNFMENVFSIRITAQRKGIVHLPKGRG